ncbi:hypothetical protein ABT403_13245 [Streptomyces sp. NPDC000075]
MTLKDLLARLDVREGVWDRPDGWLPGPVTKTQRRANSLYRLGSKALRRNAVEAAARWLAEATRDEHPGAVFRLAAAASRMESPNSDWAVRMLVGWAAVLKHRDAVQLAPLLSNRDAMLSVGAWDDPEFTPEILQALRHPRILPALDFRSRTARRSGAPKPPLVGRFRRRVRGAGRSRPA